jgi:hypothetical protein
MNTPIDSCKISQLVDDSIPGKKVALVITSPGFGSSSVNSGFIRVSLVQPNEEKNLKRNCGEIDQMDQTIPRCQNLCN